MGLDVYIYKGLKKVESPVFDAHGDCTNEPDAVYFYENPDFPGRIDGIEAHPTHYTCESVEDVISMGYVRYNNWRDLLAKFAGYSCTRSVSYGVETFRHDTGAWQASGGPFFELINFSDCEGTIGPVTAKKLADDFANNLHRIEEFEGSHDAYRAFQSAFEEAAKGHAALKFS